MHLSSKDHHIEESGIFVRGLLLFNLPGTEGSWRLWNGFTLSAVFQLGATTELVQKEASQEPRAK